MKKAFKTIALYTAAIVAVILIPFTGFCQDPVVVLDTPQDFVNPGNVNALTIGITVILGYLARFIPGVAKVKGYVRAIVAGTITVAGFATFKFGFLSQETVTYILAAFLPNFAFAGLTWESIKFILNLLKIKIPGITAQANG